MRFALAVRSVAVLAAALVVTGATLVGAPAAHAQTAPALTFDTPYDGIGATPGFGFAGTGVTGDPVAVTDDGPEGTNVPVCNATVDAAGNWTCTPGSTAQEGIGVHQYTVTETDPATGVTATVTIKVQVTSTPMTITDMEPSDGPTAGGTEVTITGTNIQPGSTVSIDGGPLITPSSISADGTILTFTTPAHAAGAANVRVMTPSNGAFFPVEFDFVPPSPPTINAPLDESTLTNPTPTITGTGSPSDTVTVTLNGATVCTATVDASATWSCIPTAPLPIGSDQLQATQSDGTGTSDPAVDTIVIVASATSPLPSPSSTSPTPGLPTTGVRPSLPIEFTTQPSRARSGSVAR